MQEDKIYKILVIDEEKILGDMLKHSIQTEVREMEVESVCCVKDALFLVERNDFDVIIAHSNITEELLSMIENIIFIKSIMPIVIISNREQIEDFTRVALIKTGISFILENPYTIPEVLAIIENLLRLNEIYKDLEHFENTLVTLSRAIEIKDPYTVGHSEAVADLAVKIFDEIGLEGYQRKDLYVGCLLHDIGKIGISDATLNKKTSLTEEEFKSVKEHPLLGYNICSNLNKAKGSINIILQHHEKLDGSGYPNKLKGQDIGFLSQICTVADVYHAMTSSRSYRDAMSKEAALDEIYSEVKKERISMYLYQILEKVINKEVME